MKQLLIGVGVLLLLIVGYFMLRKTDTIDDVITEVCNNDKFKNNMETCRKELKEMVSLMKEFHITKNSDIISVLRCLTTKDPYNCMYNIGISLFKMLAFTATLATKKLLIEKLFVAKKNKFEF